MTGKWICRKVAEICLLLNVWATTTHFPESGRDLQRFAEICQIALNFAFHSICVCGATQEICGPPKNWLLHDDNEAMRQSFAQIGASLQFSSYIMIQHDIQHYLIQTSCKMVSPGFRRPTPTATAASDIFTRRQADVVSASRCIFLSVCFADVVPWRLGLILSVGRRAYRLYGVSPAAGRTPPGILNQASTRTRLSAQTHKETLARESVEKSKLQKHFSRFHRFKS